MIYIIMCGGKYNDFAIPKQLTKINGERLVDRTIRLLQQNGIKKDNIYISTNDDNQWFDEIGVMKLKKKNSYIAKNGKNYGYWLDAYYLVEDDMQVCYLYGDVYYSEKAIKTIVNYQSDENTLFGTGIAKNELHENWGEPFAYKVFNNKEFKKGIEAVKKLQDEGKTKRIAITWELYRYLNNLDINKQQVLDKTYICIDDETKDIDEEKEIKELLNKIRK